MKLVNFSASIDKGSNKLLCQSDKNFLTINESFSVRIEDEYYSIREIKKEEIWFDFSQITQDDKKYIVITDLDKAQFFSRDFVEMYIKEYAIEKHAMIADGGSGYEEGQVIVHEEYGGKCNVNIRKVEDGKVTSVSLDNVENFFVSGHREISPQGAGGKDLKIVVEFTDTKKIKVIEKNVRSSAFAKGANYISFEYPIPEFVPEGQIKIYRSTITLDKENLKDFDGQIICIAQKIDQTPKMKIPIVERGTINAFKMYNEGAMIIEDKFIELEKRIIELESRI